MIMKDIKEIPGYLVCNKCHGYYKIQEGENFTDFSYCYCGGDLQYLAELPLEYSIESDYKSSSPNYVKGPLSPKKSWFNRRSNPDIILIGAVVLVLGLIIIMIVSGNLFITADEPEESSLEEFEPVKREPHQRDVVYTPKRWRFTGPYSIRGLNPSYS